LRWRRWGARGEGGGGGASHGGDGRGGRWRKGNVLGKGMLLAALKTAQSPHLTPTRLTSLTQRDAPARGATPSCSLYHHKRLYAGPPIKPGTTSCCERLGLQEWISAKALARTLLLCGQLGAQRMFIRVRPLCARRIDLQSQSWETLLRRAGESTGTWAERISSMKQLAAEI